MPSSEPPPGSAHPSPDVFRAYVDQCPAWIYIKDEDRRHLFGNISCLEVIDQEEEEFLGTRTAETLSPDVAPAIERADREVLEGGAVSVTELWTDLPAGDRVYLRDVKFPIVGPSGERLIGGFAVDITNRKAAEDALAEQVEFERLASEMNAELASARPADWSAAVQRALGAIGRFFQKERAFLYLLSGDRGSLEHACGWCGEGEDEHASPTLGGSIVEPLVLEHVDEGVALGGDASDPEVPGELGELLARHGVATAQLVPLLVEGRHLGMIGIADLSRVGPPVAGVRLRFLANLIGSSLARTRYEEALQAAIRRLVGAQEEERRRIALELHDDTSQQLVSIAMDLAVLRKRLGSTVDADAALRELAARARDLAGEIHGISRRLHSSVVEELGLRRAVASELDALEEQAELRVESDLAFGGKDELAPHVAVSLFRIVQEGLRNVRKHARARSARVTLEREQGDVVLRLEDTGVGFDPGAGPVAGIGLAGMEERARLLGGDLTVESAPGRGTRITARVPLEGALA
jgi:PAS domain S-box-containing protein